jgi:hypothetical protein
MTLALRELSSLVISLFDDFGSNPSLDFSLISFSLSLEFSLISFSLTIEFSSHRCLNFSYSLSLEFSSISFSLTIEFSSHRCLNFSFSLSVVKVGNCLRGTLCIVFNSCSLRLWPFFFFPLHLVSGIDKAASDSTPEDKMVCGASRGSRNGKEPDLSRR